MYNQAETILSQYELEVKQISRGRGTYVCETNRGEMLLSPFHGSKDRAVSLQKYLQQLARAGYYVEQIYDNKFGEALSVDEISKEAFILKSGVRGTELCTSRYSQMIEGAGVLAAYHTVSHKICQSMEWSVSGNSIMDSRIRHYKELVKIQGFIRNRKKKQEFEQLYMKYIYQMLECCQKSIELLQLPMEQVPYRVVCHGDCNQHNILMGEREWHLVNFENCVYDWAVWDLSTYIRKMMEKNCWDAELGMELVRGYYHVRKPEREELRILYALLLFPEKFWKISNHYMNSNKAWIPARDTEKLKKVIEIEPKRLIFLQNLFSNLME